MRIQLPSVPYPPSRQGYWHPITATLNFCEEDYYATIYSAEIVNTLTNLMFAYLAFKGGLNWWRNQHDTIFLVAWLGYFCVAVGSCLYHSTLKYPMQLVDELSMIYTTCLMCYASFSHGRPPGFRTLLGLGLVGLCVFITLYYHYLQNPVFHQNAYGILTATVVFRSMYLMEVNLRPSRRRSAVAAPDARQRDGAPGQASTKRRRETEDRRDAAILKSMWVMVAVGLSVFIGGFAIWNIDNIYCSRWRRWRRQIGLPWGILLEGHGWWHFMTGIGAYFYIVWGTWLRHCLNGRQDEFRLQWPSLLFSLPQVVRVDRTDASESHENGAAKKMA